MKDYAQTVINLNKYIKQYQDAYLKNDFITAVDLANVIVINANNLMDYTENLYLNKSNVKK